MRIDLTYDYLIRHVVPGPHWPTFLLALAALPIALLIPRTVLSRRANAAVFVPVIAGLILHSCCSTDGWDAITVDTLLWAFFLLVLRDPWADFRRLDPNTLFSDQKLFRRKDKIGHATGSRPSSAAGSGDEHFGRSKANDTPRRPGGLFKRVSFRAAEEAYPEDSFVERVKWVGTLLVSIRLTNWKIGTDSHDRVQPRPSKFASRRAFVAHTLISLVRGYLILDLTRAYINHDPYFSDLTVSIDDPAPEAVWAIASSLPPAIIRTTITGLQAWTLVSEMFYLPCLIPVALNYYGLIPDAWSPHLWPSYFGPLRTILGYGVRGFWGKYWHQTMRWCVAGSGYAVADAIGLHPLSLIRYSVITISAFAFSGIVHSGLVPPEPLHATLPVDRIRLLVAGFFWVQPVACLAEAFVAESAHTHSSRAYWRKGFALFLRLVVNGVWTFAWFSMTLRLLSEAARQLNYWSIWPVPFSIWQGVHGYGWIAWPFLLD